MTTFTADNVSRDANTRHISAGDKQMANSRLHNGPVARLLARVAKWSGEYADYQMEAGAWRKLSL